LINRAVYVDSTHIKCEIPNYPQPDILPLEVTMNGEDYSNDGKTFGFYDPFVLSVEPKLISKSGNTKVTVKGFGFVDTSKQLKTKFETEGSDLQCVNNCVMGAAYDSKHQIISSTPPYSGVKKDGHYLQPTDALEVEVSVYGDQYTNNNIEVFYYDEPEFSEVSPRGVPSNGQDPILIKTDFKFDKNS